MKQEFPTERKFHFNLRKPKGGQATPIYFVVSIEGKQYKFATNVKVNPRYWDNTRQIAVISNTNTRLNNKNNRIVNERLEQIKAYYMEFICYLCNQEETPANVVEVLKTYIYKDMAKKKTLTIDVIKTIKSAFDYYYTNISQVKESTLRVTEDKLKSFISYIEEKNLNNSVEVFSQTGLNAYKDYLIESMNRDSKIGKNRINELCQLIERLINNVLIINNEYKQYKFAKVGYVKIIDKRQQDDICRFPLFNDEIQAIKDCTTLTNMEQEYRTIFLLQCASGQRISDILQVIKGNYEEKDGVITLQTIKKEIFAQIFITNEIKNYLQEIKQIMSINLIKFNEHKYNKTIKDICQKAGLNRTIRYKDSKGNSFEKPLWQVVVSHDARHTFITNKVKEGIPYETLCLMTGHADDKMIKSVYANLTKEDKADKVRKYFNKSEITGEQIISSTKKSQTDINEVLELMKPDKDISVYEFDTDLINKDIQTELENNKEFIEIYDLNQSDIKFIIKSNIPIIEVGYHSIKIMKQIKRLMERGLIICTYKGSQYPEQLNDIMINPKYKLD